MIKINQSKKFKKFFDQSPCSRKIDFIILHHVESENVETAIELFKKHQVSAHYLISDDGEIFQLVDDNNIAHHCGISNFMGIESLNKTSIGIEFLSKDVNKIGFNKEQMASALELLKILKVKYKINDRNFLAHSDIAYDKDSGFLNRKDDPSHLFNWKFLSENNVGIYPKLDLQEKDDKILYEFGQKNNEIAKIKQNLANFGYKLTNFNENFDEEFVELTKVFNRRFAQNAYKINSGSWFLSSNLMLKNLKKQF